MASQWINDRIDYTGVDVVEDMIRSHQQAHASEHVRFMCLDIVEDELPEGDLCTVRQVLQHLSNDDVSRVLAKLRKYKYVIITSSNTPKSQAASYNIDIHTGPATRCFALSGLYLDEPPFNLKTEKLLSVPEIREKDKVRVEIITELIRN